MGLTLGKSRNIHGSKTVQQSRLMVRSRACEATWHISTLCSREFLMFLLCYSQSYPWRCRIQYGNSAHIILDQRFSYAGTHLKFIKFVVYGKHRGSVPSCHVIDFTHYLQCFSHISAAVLLFECRDECRNSHWAIWEDFCHPKMAPQAEDWVFESQPRQT